MALLYSWNTVVATQNDADSPLTEDWGEAMRQNDYHLRQTVYGDGAGGFKTAADGHTHNGTDSVGVVVPNDTIGRDAINFNSTELNWNIGPTSNQIIPKGLFLAIWDSSVAGNGILQAFMNGAWTTITADLNTTAWGSVVSNGVDMRVRNTSGAGIVVYYWKQDA